jgi:hypothetical protein
LRQRRRHDRSDRRFGVPAPSRHEPGCR